MYVCEWEREDSPTRGLSDAALRDYYRDHSVRGDALFALRPDTSYPADLQASWRELIGAIALAGKETAAHRKIRDEIKRAWRYFAGGLPYQVPTIEPAKRQRRAAACCPNCGFSAAA